jgi:predicted phage-related endonuclease
MRWLNGGQKFIFKEIKRDEELISIIVEIVSSEFFIDRFLVLMRESDLAYMRCVRSM